MKISAVKSRESMKILVTVELGMDELMDNGTKEVALNELEEAFNAEIDNKDKLALLEIIARARK